MNDVVTCSRRYKLNQQESQLLENKDMIARIASTFTFYPTIDTLLDLVLICCISVHPHSIMNIDDAPQASTSNMLDLTVSHGGQQHQLSIAASATLVELQEALYQATQVAPASQKLIYKGKPLISPSNVSSTLSALNITNGSKLLLIGAKDATVSAFVKEAQDLQKRLEISKWRPTVKPRSTPAHGKMVMDLNDLRRSGNNAYGRIEVLPNCPHEDLRKDRLIRLSKDEAVLGELLYMGSRNMPMTAC